MTTEPLQMQPSEESYASLQLVAQEVSTELNEARIVLEAFGERPEERGLIGRCPAFRTILPTHREPLSLVLEGGDFQTVPALMTKTTRRRA